MDPDTTHLFESITELKEQINKKAEKLKITQNQKIQNMESEINNLNQALASVQKELQDTQASTSESEQNQKLNSRMNQVKQARDSKIEQIDNLSAEIKFLEAQLEDQNNVSKTLAFVKSIAPISIKSVDGDNISGMVAYGTMDTTEFFNLSKTDPETSKNLVGLLNTLIQKL